MHRAPHPSKALYEDFYGKKYSKKDAYQGVSSEDYDALEQHFEVNSEIYDVDDTYKATVIRRSPSQHDETINLCMYGEHFLLITKLEKLIKDYVCARCNKALSSRMNLHRHMKTDCQDAYKDVFVSKPVQYEPNAGVLAKLLRKYPFMGRRIPRYYPYHVVYDFEAILKASDRAGSTKLSFTSEHVPVSVSVSSSVPGFDTARFLHNGDPKELVVSFVNYLTEIQEAAEIECLRLFKPFIDYLTDRDARDHDTLTTWLKEIPVVGFNSGGYDINLIKDYGFFNMLFGATDDSSAFVVKKDNNYMAISNGEFKFLDITSYLAPGFSYDKYIRTYLKEEIDAGTVSTKGFFPYEWMDSYDRLQETCLPPHEAFYSSLKDSNITAEDYAYCQQAWNDNQMTTMLDFLRWYNNLDVVPFVSAIEKNKSFYQRYQLDMLKDAVSLPGLAERIMYKCARSDLQAFAVNDKLQPSPDGFRPDHNQIIGKINGYRSQDRERLEENKGTYVDEETVNELFDNQSGKCFYCQTNLTADDDTKWTLDRMDNKACHNVDNVLLACLKCNRERADHTTHYAFARGKRLERYNEHNPQLYLIDEANKGVFNKLKDAVVGGPSIIFHRYHEAGKTRIKRPIFNEETQTFKVGIEGKLVKSIVGYDANALYLWALSQEMPCGQLAWTDTTSFNAEQEEFLLADVMSGELYCFIEVDIKVPRYLYEKFSEMAPFFKNTTIEPVEHVVGSYMYKRATDLDKKPARKLIGSMWAKKYLVSTQRLRWYLEHGMIVSKVHGYIKATPNAVFKSFTDEVSNARREGDTDPSKAILADSMKLVGNSAHGRSSMNKNRHAKIKYVSDGKFCRSVNDFYFRDACALKLDDEITYECSFGKGKVKQNICMQVGGMIYDLAKLRMLQFHYDCLDRYIDRSDYQLCEMDTDSSYMALTGEFDDLIKPEHVDEFDLIKHSFFPRDDTEEHRKHDRRVPGLFKEEYKPANCTLCRVRPQTTDASSPARVYRRRTTQTS